MTTTMQADFHQAHDRHWLDAEFLLGDQRWANADQIYGFCVECGLKKLMLAFGMNFDSNRDMPASSDDRVHADKIWPRYEAYRCGHPAGTKYALPITNPFDDWSANQRYATTVSFDAARTSRHQTAASQVRQLIKQAEKDGLI